MNLGNPQELTILEFAERIRRITGTSAPLEFKPLPQDDPKRRQPNIAKAKARARLGTEGQPGRRASGNDRLFSEAGRSGVGAPLAANSTQTLAAAPAPSCTALSSILSVSVSS